MSEVVTVMLDTRELDRISAGLNKNTQQIIEGAAFEVERMAKQMAPIDTGALRNSIYTATRSDNRAPNPLHGESVSPIPSPSGNIFAVVGAGVDYAIFVELGTHRMADQPFLSPSVEYVARKVNSGEYWKELCQ